LVLAVWVDVAVSSAALLAVTPGAGALEALVSDDAVVLTAASLELQADAPSSRAPTVRNVAVRRMERSYEGMK